MSEQFILEKAQQGEREALGRLYEHYVDAVYRYMFYRTGHHETAEDLTAEVFASVITSIKSYEDLGVPFEAWLFRIAHARLVDYWRKSKHREQQEVELSQEVEEFFIGDAPEDQFRHEEVLHAMEYLTSTEREVVVLRFAAGLDNQEIAQTLQRNANAVKSMLHRALEKLRGVLAHRSAFDKSETGNEKH